VDNDGLDLTGMERGALTNFLAGQGPLRSALEKFTAFHSQRMKAGCSTAMATVPRSIESASDYAAKAQLLDEFWELMLDAASNDEGAGIETAPAA
jgi:hypothetical protein